MLLVNVCRNVKYTENDDQRIPIDNRSRNEVQEMNVTPFRVER